MHKRVDQQQKAFSRSLRISATKEEKHVWYDCLKKLPYTFCRQRAFGKYIVDFFCAEAKLVIEIDGCQHYSEKGLEYDRERDEYLRGIGLEVVRYNNHEVNTNFDGVYLDIARIVRERVELLHKR